MAVVENGVSNNHVESNDVDRSESVRVSRSNDRTQTNGVLNSHKSDEDLGFKKEIRDLEEMLSKLNPMAEEFVPPSLSNNNGYNHINNINNININNININGVVLQSPPPPPPPPPAVAARFGYGVVNEFMMQSNHTGFGNINGVSTGRKKGNYGNGKRRLNSRTNMAQQEDAIKRTIHVSDIDQQVTEEQLAALFVSCGQVVDCRVCGDPNSVLRFAFIEFTDEEGAKNALSLAGTMLGYYPLRVLPSKTAIAPVNPTFLPRSEDEREMCARTIYCTNIDKKVTQADVKLFFETFCGEVYRLRLLGDYHHSSRIAFVEFVMAESAIAALNCSGAVLGSLPIRVSPSKTPVRPRTTRPTMN
ncbi:putative RNA recognition motif domain, ataxin-2, RNA-binding domain superfamily [Helianthus annuus]|nr:putative RNA recognition motif domain, ataxin-2, RNA-binding domain superfamily [Helianthus annuus]